MTPIWHLYGTHMQPIQHPYGTHTTPIWHQYLTHVTPMALFQQIAMTVTAPQYLERGTHLIHPSIQLDEDDFKATTYKYSNQTVSII